MSLPTDAGDLAGTEVTAELLARATEEAQSAVCITDADLDSPGPRIVYVNPAFTRITGYAASEVIGRNPRILQGPRTDRSLLDQVRANLTAGGTFEGETYNYRKDGSPFRMAWRIAPVHDDAGTVTHYVAAQEDVTTLRDAEALMVADSHDLQADSDWLSALVQLSVAVNRTADPDDVLTAVVEAATGPLGADGAAIVLADEEHQDWVLSHAAGIDRADPGARFEPRPASLIGQALVKTTSTFRSETQEQIGAGLGTHDGALAVLPIGSGAVGAYGVLVLTWQDRPAFRPVERTHLGLLAQLTTMTHRKSKELDDQRSLATTLQRFLLPEITHLVGLEVASRYHAASDGAQVGGDWFDLVCLDDERMVVFVGDVVGHGSEAAALMGEIRFTARGILRHFTDPAEILDELDGALLTTHEPGQAMATLCAVVIDGDGTLTYCSAGHPYPVLRRANGHIDVLAEAQCRLIGASEDGTRFTAQAQLHPGDALVAFSDGVFEARDETYDDSYDALVARLARADDTLTDICDAALGLENGGPSRFRDDTVVLAVRRPLDGGSSPCPAG